MRSEQELLELLGNIGDNAQNLKLLLDQVRSRIGIIPFVGAGMSVPFGFLEWTRFLLFVGEKAGKTGDVQARLAAGQYEEAAENLIEAVGPGKFQEFLEAEFGDERLRDRILSGAIMRIPEITCGPVLTTNFDRVIETAFRQSGTSITPIWESTADRAGKALQQDTPVLLKLHGDWASPGSRVLTLAEYEKQYGSATVEVDLNRPLPSLLFAIVVTRCLLFLGCSLTQDRTVSLLTRMARRFTFNRHFAIVERPAEDAEFNARLLQLWRLNLLPLWYPTSKHELIEPLLAYVAEQAATSTGSARPCAVAVSVTPAPTRNNLPNLATPLIGRHTELQQLAAMLESVPLITITGAPGCGKTRLAIQLAANLRGGFPAGTWLIELDSLREPALIAQRIASVMGMREQAKEPPLEALADYLKTRRSLLVLDNCEHLVQACAATAEYLIERCPDLRIVATSRTVLNAQSGYTYQLWPLKTPEPDEDRPESLAQNEAVQLFVQRAQSRLNGFALTKSNARAVGELCRALDGIPLAIQLAAARLGVLSVDDIVRDLQSGLGVLRGPEVSQRRHWDTLTAALKWSYKLLKPASRAFLRRLAVFDGGWTRQAAAALCGPEKGGEDVTDDLLQDLHDQSLVVSVQRNGSTRFRFLEPVRQYAMEELGAAGEKPVYERRHAEWFVRFSEQAAPELLGDKQIDWLDLVTTEADNLRAAIRWAVASDETEIALRLTSALWRFCEIRGFFAEGRERLKSVLNMPASTQYPALRSTALSGAGILAYRQGDFDAAEQMFAESLQLERGLNNPRGLANALNDLGNVALMKGEIERGLSLYRESLDLERQTGHERGIAVGLFNTGSTLFRLRELDEAAGLLHESWDRFSRSGNLRDGAFPLNTLGLVCVERGDLELAADYAARSLDIRKQVGDKRGIAETLRTTAAIEIEKRNWANARENLIESMQLARGVGDRRGIMESLEWVGRLECRRGRMEEGVLLYSASEALRQQLGMPLASTEAAARESELDKARAALPAEQYERAWRKGSALSAGDAAERAAEDSDLGMQAGSGA